MTTPEVEAARQGIVELAGAERWSDHDYALLQGQIDNFAHALAELQRNAFKGIVPPPSYFVYFRRAADLIDPYKETRDWGVFEGPSDLSAQVAKERFGDLVRIVEED